MRFVELRTTVDGISGKVLADTLRDLERDGLIARHAYSEVPPRVEYELTPLRRTLHELLRALGRRVEEHIAAAMPPPRRSRRRSSRIARSPTRGALVDRCGLVRVGVRIDAADDNRLVVVHALRWLPSIRTAAGRQGRTQQ